MLLEDLAVIMISWLRINVKSPMQSVSAQGYQIIEESRGCSTVSRDVIAAQYLGRLQQITEVDRYPHRALKWTAKFRLSAGTWRSIANT